MSNRCVDCKFHYSGYEWDEVDEENYLIDICGEGHTEYIESSEECPSFKNMKECHTLRSIQNAINANCFMNAKKRDD